MDELVAVELDLAEDPDHARGSPSSYCLDSLVTHSGHRVLLSPVDDVVGAVLFGHLKPRRLDVDGDDPSAEGLRQHGATQADGPLPEDRHSLIGGQTDPLDRGEGRPRATRDGRTGLERERVGQPDQRVCGNLHEVRMTTVTVEPAVDPAPIRTVLRPA